jgi:putative oxidoreductase
VKLADEPRYSWVILLIRWIVGGAFIVAGVLKILDPAQFSTSIANYRVLPHELNNLVAITLPWVEVIAGLALVGGLWPRSAAFVITGMTAMFAVLIVSALVRGLNITCGCFGTVGGTNVGLQNLAIDSTLLVMAGFLSWRLKE